MCHNCIYTCSMHGDIILTSHLITKLFYVRLSACLWQEITKHRDRSNSTTGTLNCGVPVMGVQKMSNWNERKAVACPSPRRKNHSNMAIPTHHSHFAKTTKDPIRNVSISSGTLHCRKHFWLKTHNFREDNVEISNNAK